MYISVDPYMRSIIAGIAHGSVKPVQEGEVMPGDSCGTVIRSSDPFISEGTYVVGRWGWQTHAVTTRESVRVWNNEFPLSYSLGVLGMPGATAFFGLFSIGRPKRGETIVVSGGCGTVGSVVGQMGKKLGLRVIGIAGSEEKCDIMLEEFRYDYAVCYKTCGNLDVELRKACPQGIDVYWDNVGGATLDAALGLANVNARFVECGMISGYNNLSSTHKFRNMAAITTQGVTLKGFVYGRDTPHSLEEDTYAFVGSMLKDKGLIIKETIITGFKNVETAFLGLFEGKNVGKTIVKV